MPRNNFMLAAACLAIAWPFAATLAQNHDASASYAELSLHAGFTPDPEVIALDAGGSFDAGSLGGHCVGYINPDAPDVGFEFSNPRQPLNIYAISSADTTLVVRMPNGNWLCDDDSHGYNPLVQIAKPIPGRYAVWVGLFLPEHFESAQLYISELEPQWTSSTPANVDAAPLYGVIPLSRGFQPDPQHITLMAGGDDDAGGIDFACNGYIAADQPDVVIELDGSLPMLSVYAMSETDTTLVVHTPGGEWLCDDDSHEFHPAITLDGTAGSYAVWIGTFGGGTAEAELHVSAGAPQWTPSGDTAPVVPGEDAEPMFDLAGLSALEAFMVIAETAPPGGLEWSSAEPLGNEGFVLRDVVMRPDPVDDPTELRLDRLVVNRIDLESAARETPPTYLDIVLEGMVIPFEGFGDEEWAAYLDVDQLILNLGLAYRLDEASAILDLEHLRFELLELGVIDTRLRITGFDIANIMMAFMMEDPTGIQSGVESAEFGYRDRGFLHKILMGVAAEEGQTLDGMIERLVGEMRAQLVELGLSGDQRMQAMAAASERFMRDIPRGSGRLTVSLNPPEPIDLATLFSLLATPDQAADRLGLSVEYDTTVR